MSEFVVQLEAIRKEAQEMGEKVDDHENRENDDKNKLDSLQEAQTALAHTKTRVSLLIDLIQNPEQKAKLQAQFEKIMNTPGVEAIDDQAEFDKIFSSILSIFNSPQEISETNKKLRNFPNEIPGAKSIEKIETPDAQHCLVHLRWKHHVFYEGMNEEAEAIYNDLSQILKSLINQNQLSGVYQEGQFVENKGVLIPLPESGFSMFHDDNTSTNDPYRKFVHGPAIDLYLEKKLHIYPAESKPLNKKGNTAMERLLALPEHLSDEEIAKQYPDIWKNYQQDTLKAREDFLLQTIADKKDPFSIALYGGGHDWRDNIEEWNQNHPNQKFSIIIITPSSYNDD